ncbi:hypothetical protein POM88_050121 [Heracleum sosnowskyi]|uniref:ClpA/ClpB AAA lid domain-containing protein n=1 Tax=Heracleum sosnowskyi TaxID=360622 RepID=A0AAD8M034_9APIA|nr:hypothetical protein POM88_050121 [Heracleum sosnowskyi]
MKKLRFLESRIINGSIPSKLQETKVFSIDMARLLLAASNRGEFEERLIKVVDEVKPTLARGELKCIGATTMEEYMKYIEKDGALKRAIDLIDEAGARVSLQQKQDKYDKVTVATKMDTNLRVNLQAQQGQAEYSGNMLVTEEDIKLVL